MSEPVWTPVEIPLSKLEPWERNPKTISKSHAKRLLENWKRLGQWQTLAIGPLNGKGKAPLYDGHQRANVIRAAYGDGYVVKALQSDRPLTDEERAQVTARTGLVVTDGPATGGRRRSRTSRTAAPAP